jgi:hypothetical protein
MATVNLVARAYVNCVFYARIGKTVVLLLCGGDDKRLTAILSTDNDQKTVAVPNFNNCPLETKA